MTRGFIYMVAQVGITGARESLSDELPDFIARVRAATTTPLALGFGISKPAHMTQIRQQVDGFLVGSALLRAMQNAWGRSAPSSSPARGR